MGLLWDVFCRVVDNFGDIGVCWRLASDLASRGQAVRLWTDDDRALRWMAPSGQPGVEVLRWAQADAQALPGDVVIEAFACDPPAAFVAAMAAQAPPPVWINLEYLSAEDWVTRCHGLPSPRNVDPGAGLIKWFYQPGFKTGTGGLLREASIWEAQRTFSRPLWLQQRLGLTLEDRESLVVVFCYDARPIGTLVDALTARSVGTAVRLALTPGAASEALKGAELPPNVRRVHLPWLTQHEFDRLLWSADLNLVRGEDSAVRAIWAGAPFVWQLYPQHDLAHHAKAQAFLDLLAHIGAVDAGLEPLLTAWWRRCNGMDIAEPTSRRHAQAAWPTPAQWQAWRQATVRLRQHLAEDEDLVTRLINFVHTHRTVAGRTG